ncbi:hypothetical protein METBISCDRAFT_23170 [Metschnikowia bicuspidata]|uniref:Uncharacterized protein n=1 Tax=Metschnikowia bicuspidata TaxID=27322 RepID=A0A4P9ZCL7_9ASCO|nr:hypothetical protein METBISCDRAFT_23170 [Metschnikowia bicuspidata]
MLECEFLNQFSQKFLPAIGQIHFRDNSAQQNLVISGASTSDLLRGIFVACGACMIAHEDPSCKRLAVQRYSWAMRDYLSQLKKGGVDGSKDWLLDAVQVLQTLCYRASFASANATRVALHFGAAYRFIRQRIGSSLSIIAADSFKILKLDLMMVENCVFNYPVTVMFCEHKRLPELMVNPCLFYPNEPKTQIIVQRVEIPERQHDVHACLPYRGKMCMAVSFMPPALEPGPNFTF